MKYPIGIQDFEDLRSKGFVYVDKTAFVYELADRGKYYFLSRPRRFGKSLLLTTMEAYFSGKKELFAGLAIEKLEKDWIEYPVLHLDLNTGTYTCEEGLLEVLSLHVSKWESIYGKNNEETTAAARLQGVVQRAYEKTGKQVVILIDEYDKPILQTFDNEELQEKYRSTLKSFYSVLKTNDKYIKFAFLTGVTKFSRLSVFSDLNNLQDISMNSNYATICGITEDEIHQYFEESVHKLANANHLSYEATLQRLKEQYDGYHFGRNCVGIYNPFSLLNTLNNCEFNDYWFETGTPTFLVKCLQQNHYDLNNLQKEQVTADILGSIESIKTNPIPLIYQTGYLTIKDYNERFASYTLSFPNQEVERGFTQYILPYYLPIKTGGSRFNVANFVNYVEQGKVEEFLQLLQTFFDDNDYRVQGNKELYFQNAMYLVFKMMGFYTEVEHATAKGRVDVLIKTNDYIYVIELKLDGSADEALQQIEEKGYAKPYENDPRKLYKIGINFSSETRSVAEWRLEVRD